MLVKENNVQVLVNVQVLKNLRLHPTWADFFCTSGYDFGVYESMGELRVGEKFGEGAQAELFHAHVTWRNSKDNKVDVEHGIEWVVKVFKKGAFLRHLQRQLPHELLQFRAAERKNW